MPNQIKCSFSHLIITLNINSYRACCKEGKTFYTKFNISQQLCIMLMLRPWPLGLNLGLLKSALVKLKFWFRCYLLWKWTKHGNCSNIAVLKSMYEFEGALTGIDGDGAPARVAMLEDIVLEPLVFFGRPQALSVLWLRLCNWLFRWLASHFCFNKNDDSLEVIWKQKDKAWAMALWEEQQEQ